MISFALKPGVSVMQRLRMPLKFAIVSLAFLLPLGYVLFVAVSQKNDEIDFSAKERIGVTQIRLLLPVLYAQQAMRTHHLVALANKNANAPGEDGARVDKLFADASAQIKTDGDPLALSDALNKTAQAIAQARSAQTGDPIQALDAESGASASLLALITLAADNSNLTLDPDVDTYYLMNMLTVLLPNTLEHTTKEVALGGYLASMRDDTATRLMVLHDAGARAEEYGGQIEGNLVKVRDANADAAKRVDAHALSQLDQLAKRFDTEFPYGRPSAVQSAAFVADGENVVQTGQAMIASIVPVLDELLGTRIGRLETKRTTMLVVSSLSILLAAYLLTSFYISSVGGFQAITQRVDRLGTGDLSPSWPAQGNDELSLAINTLRESVGSLAAIVKGVRSNAEDIAVATTQISEGNNDLAARGARIAATVQQTTASMEALNATVARNLDGTQQASRFAGDAYQIALRSGDVVSQAVQTMDSITASSKKIGDIISVIDGIAFQTNILALNAAVEAARAGEQGRGFAVVAAEVRTLAQRSATAAKEINGLVKQSIGTVDAGAARVHDAGRSMKDVVAAIQQVTEVMAQIAAASNSQHEEIQQVRRAVIEIDDATQQNSALVEEISAAATSLQERAHALSDSVRTFKVDGKSV